MSRFGRGYPMMSAIHHPPPRVPVAYDATGSGQTGTATSLSWTHIITGNAVLAAVNLEVYGSTPPTVTAKVGSTPMAQLGFISNYSTGTYCESAAIFGLLSSPTGSQTVTITSSATTYSAANSVSYSNVIGFGTVATNTGNGSTASISAGAAGWQMVANAFFNSSYPNADLFNSYNQTSRYSTTYNYNGFLMGDAAGASRANFSATLPYSNPWAAFAVPLL